MDLMAELDAMVEAERKRKAVEKKTAKPTVANADVAPIPSNPLPMPRAIRRIAFIRRQTCPTCEHHTLVTCGLGLEVETDQRYVRRSIVADWKGYTHLELTVEELEAIEVECPACLNAAVGIEAIFAGHFQLSLGI
jgi:hypothetical protein